MMTDVQAEIERLTALRDRGMVSEAEYRAERARLLAGTSDPAEPPALARRHPGLRLIGLLAVILLLVVALAALGRCSHQTLKLPAPRRAPDMIPASRSPPVPMGTGKMAKAAQAAQVDDANQQANEPVANGD